MCCNRYRRAIGSMGSVIEIDYSITGIDLFTPVIEAINDDAQSGDVRDTEADGPASAPEETP